jgi:hypothetical protein
LVANDIEGGWLAEQGIQLGAMVDCVANVGVGGLFCRNGKFLDNHMHTLL